MFTRSLRISSIRRFFTSGNKNPSVIIRNVSRDDMDSFVEIYTQAYEGFEEYAYTSRKEIRNYFKWLYGRDSDGFFVAETDEPVGFSACDTNWISPFERNMVAELHELFVRVEYRGKGVASELLVRSEKYGREKGRKIMGLWVGIRNLPAKRFYLKHGFNETGRLGKWIRMAKEL